MQHVVKYSLYSNSAMSCANTAELIKVLLRIWIWVGPRKYASHGVHTGGYTQVYAIYQPPVYFAGIYSPQLPYMNRVYAGYTPCSVA